ncbi:Proteophosphoglycan 5 [Rhodotorula toruloides]|nr:Proteophosphoglycan 5 [Rhodotorula toruloides]
MRHATLSLDHLTPPRPGERRPELPITDQSQERMLGIPILFRNEFSAAIKLINCTLVGVSMCNVDMQFDGSRGNPTGFSDETHARA